MESKRGVPSADSTVPLEDKVRISHPEEALTPLSQEADPHGYCTAPRRAPTADQSGPLAAPLRVYPGLGPGTLPLARQARGLDPHAGLALADAGLAGERPAVPP